MYSRTVYGRPARVTPIWLWMVQRLSAVLLGPLVLLHVLVSGARAHAILGSLLLLTVLAHALSATWRLAAEKPVAASPIAYYSSTLASVAVGAVLLLLGVGVILALQ